MSKTFWRRVLTSINTLGWVRRATRGPGGELCLGAHIAYVATDGKEYQISIWDKSEVSCRMEQILDHVGAPMITDHDAGNRMIGGAVSPIRELYPNVPLLRKVLEHVESIPEWDPARRCDMWCQSTWITTLWDKETWLERCGTAACFAGWAVILSGEEESPYVSTGEQARRLLGITPREASILFAGDNTIEDLRQFAEEFAGETL